MLDLQPATAMLTQVVSGLRDDQLGDPTPCAGTAIGALLDHVDGLAVAFTASARKTELPDGSAGPSANASRLAPDWRSQVPGRLVELADAWRAPDAWTGMTKAGGQDLPGEVAGLVALDEVIVHGWDIAVASGQPYDCEPHLVEAALGFVQPTAAANPSGTPGLFGPAVPVSEEAPPLNRLLGLTGRDPSWRPEGGVVAD
jgi:uncharacterized protein (TIGR03086 family)